MRVARGARLLALTLILSIALAASAQPAQLVKLNVRLLPERLGAGTTIDFSFRIATSSGSVPLPLSAISLFYPANIGLITSGLGLVSCSSTTLEILGPEGCPTNSLMGYGSALVEIPIGPEIIPETGHLTAWMAPLENGHLGLLFYADGEHPVSAQLIFTGLVLPAPAPFGGQLETQIPAIPTLPGAPYAAVVQMRATIGPMNVTYYRHLHGKRIPYQPNGIVLPNHCPRGGFRFAATFTFIDGTQANARSAVSCPRHTR